MYLCGGMCTYAGAHVSHRVGFPGAGVPGQHDSPDVGIELGSVDEQCTPSLQHFTAFLINLTISYISHQVLYFFFSIFLK